MSSAEFGSFSVLLLVLLSTAHLLGDLFSRVRQPRVAGEILAGVILGPSVLGQIFHDLEILHTRFARLVLGVAVLEDIALWGVLAIATALAASATLPAVSIVTTTTATLVFFGLGLTLVPRIMGSITRASWNVFARHAPVGYLVAVLFAFTAVAAALEVNLAFAAFVAGYALVRADDLKDARATLNRVSFAVFIPIYFAVVGYQLDVTRTFAFAMVAFVLVAACLAKLVSAGLGARLAGFPSRDSVNLAIVLNARGGPGIVLASVAESDPETRRRSMTAVRWTWRNVW